MDALLAPWTPVLAGFGVGLAVASAPGPVQAVLLTEAVRGGVRRGLQALAGANLTFGSLLVSLALGVSVVRPDANVVHVLWITGGSVLLWLAIDAFRSARATGRPRREIGAYPRNGLPPAVRGAVAVTVFPGTWLFLATVASPLITTATEPGGTGMAVAAAVALTAGTGIGDAVVVLLGGLGLRAASERTVTGVRQALAIALGALGAFLLVSGVLSFLGILP